jgi:putative redox protein
MPVTTIKWVDEKRFVGTDSNGHSVVLSGDDPAVGVRPSEMLLVALGACSAYDVVDIMKKKRMPLSALEVTVDGEREADPPWPYHTICVTYRAAGPDITEKALSQAISLSEEKYCSVAATVRGVANITTAYEIMASNK